MQNQTIETLKKLAEARESARTVKAQANYMLEDFKNNPAYKLLTDKLAELNGEQRDLRIAIEKDALVLYAEDGQKKM